MSVLRRILRFFVLTLAFLGRATLVLIVVLLVGGAGVVWWFRHRANQEAKAVATEVALPRGTRAIELWFPQAAGGALELETREVVEDDAQGEKVVRTVVGALLDGPENAGLVRSFPEGVDAQPRLSRSRTAACTWTSRTSCGCGFRGGSTAEELLVTSLLRTLVGQRAERLARDASPPAASRWSRSRATSGWTDRLSVSEWR